MRWRRSATQRRCPRCSRWWRRTIARCPSRSRRSASSAPQDPRQDPSVSCSGPRKRCVSPRSAPSPNSPASSKPRPVRGPNAAGRARRRRNRLARGQRRRCRSSTAALSPSGRFSRHGDVRRLRRPNGDGHTARDAARRRRARRNLARRRPRRRRRRRRPHARYSSKGPKTTCRAAAARGAVVRPERAANGDMIEGRYKYIQKIGKGAFGTVVLVEDTVVEERLILKFLNANVCLRRGDAEALRSRAALFAPHHAQERHPHLRFLVRRRQLCDLDGVLSFAHARRGDRQREADAAEEGRRVRHATSVSA